MGYSWGMLTCSPSSILAPEGLIECKKELLWSEVYPRSEISKNPRRRRKGRRSCILMPTRSLLLIEYRVVFKESSKDNLNVWQMYTERRTFIVCYLHRDFQHQRTALLPFSSWDGVILWPGAKNKFTLFRDSSYSLKFGPYSTSCNLQQKRKKKQLGVISLREFRKRVLTP